VSRLLTAEQHH